jgi:spore germination protein Q
MSSYTNPSYPSPDTIQPAPTASMGYTQPGYQPPQYQQPGFQQPIFPQQPGFQQPTFPQQPVTGFPQLPTGLYPVQESYIENILRLNLGKLATVYMNFDNSQWGSKIFKGIIEAAGKDHIILSDPATGMRYLLLSIFLNYVTFDEEIAYEYPFATPNIPGVAPNTQFRKKDNHDQVKK